MKDTTSAKNPMARVMTIRDFRILFAGTATSLLGDQFALVATPWLTLQLTDDPLALGVVLALAGIPRAAFMLVGGAIVDRLSPRLIMFTSDIIRLFLTSLMACVVLTGAIQIWMLYVFSLAFGLVAGFAVPAENSIVPMIVAEKDLQAGNSLMMGITQSVGFIGPTLAGVMIGVFPHTSFIGIGLAFAIDAVSFAVSAVCLWLIRIGSQHQIAGEVPEEESVWISILTGMKYLWNDPALRMGFLLLAAVNLLLNGPLLVGIPVLADQRLSEGATAFGLLMSAYAGGSLVGYVLAGSLPRPSGTMMRIILIGFLTAFGVIVGALGFIPSTWVDFGLLLLLGSGNGYIGIILFTWMQTRTPKEMLGRMMSILMFAGVGLVPISQAISGAVSKWDLTLLFIAAGALVLLVICWANFQPGMKAFTKSLVTMPAGD
jgi:MFS family permease